MADKGRTSGATKKGSGGDKGLKYSGGSGSTTGATTADGKKKK